MKFRLASSTEKQMYQFDAVAIVDYTDLAALGAGNTGSFKIGPYTGGDAVTQPYNATASPATYAAGVILSLVAAVVSVPFVFSDGTLIANGVTLGDSGSAARYMASIETNAAGSYVGGSVGTGTRFLLTVADNFIAAFTGTAAKNLNTATAGQILFYLKIEDKNNWPVA